MPVIEGYVSSSLPHLRARLCWLRGCGCDCVVSAMPLLMAHVTESDARDSYLVHQSSTSASGHRLPDRPVRGGPFAGL